jgi:hypothetical protein
MPTIHERVDTLEDVLRQFIINTNRFEDEMRAFKDEMRAFKEEMRAFREESERDRRRMNKQWGEIANKMGTIVEDIVAPNIKGIAEKYFGCEDIEDFMVRRYKRNTKDRTKRREFDVIAVCDDKVILNETKATIRTEYITDFINFIRNKKFFDYFPEYKGKKIIPIFSSLYLQDDVVDVLTKAGIYAMAMKDDTMDLLNFKEIKG